jgi:hypothetical protein
MLQNYQDVMATCMLWQPAENRSKYRPQFSHPHDIELLDEQGNPKHFKIIFGLL